MINEICLASQPGTKRRGFSSVQGEVIRVLKIETDCGMVLEDPLSSRNPNVNKKDHFRWATFHHLPQIQTDDSIPLLKVCKLLSTPDLLVMSPHLAHLLKTAACLSLGTPLVVLILIAKKVTIVIFIVVNSSQITKRY